MFLLRVLEVLFFVGLLIIGVTQVVIPLLRNTPVFWILRKTPRKDIEQLQSKLAAAEEKNEIAALKEALRDRKDKA